MTQAAADYSLSEALKGVGNGEDLRARHLIDRVCLDESEARSRQPSNGRFVARFGEGFGIRGRDDCSRC